MREAADLIRAEVGRMMGDVGRLRERVLKLQQHHGQAGEDMRQILISTEKIGASRGPHRPARFRRQPRRRVPATAPASPALKLEAGE